MLAQFLNDPKEFTGEQLTGSDVTARKLPSKGVELGKKIVGALKKRYTDKNAIVKACQIASFSSWPVYSPENQTVIQGNLVS